MLNEVDSGRRGEAGKSDDICAAGKEDYTHKVQSSKCLKSLQNSQPNGYL